MQILSASDQVIADAEKQMSLCFPEGLKAVWRISNGLELPGGWMLYPVFDPAEPRRTCSHIAYENTTGRWEYMDDSLVSIAGGDTGNQLVLERQDGGLSDVILHWNHETNKTKKWSKGFDYLVQKAEARIDNIQKQIERSTKKSKKRTT